MVVCTLTLCMLKDSRMPKVSVVIPLYNQEKYVHRLFNALSRQTLKEFEALFIDDKSTDRSGELVQEYRKYDNRIKLLRLPKNGGAGAARNIGVEVASGETLCFADPDDILPDHSLEVRYQAYKKHNAIVRACYTEVDSDGMILYAEKRPEIAEIFSPACEALRVGVNPFIAAHCTWLFPTKLLQRQKIRNEEGTRTAEDIMFLVRLFFNISRMIWISDNVYYWMKQKDSLSTSTYSVQHYIDYFQCVNEFYELAESANTSKLGDILCNEYLCGYLPHLSGQLARGQSTEQDARNIIDAVINICVKHGTFTRMAKGNIASSQSGGVRWLNSIRQHSAPTMVQKIIDEVITGSTHH